MPKQVADTDTPPTPTAANNNASADDEEEATPGVWQMAFAIANESTQRTTQNCASTLQLNDVVARLNSTDGFNLRNNYQNDHDNIPNLQKISKMAWDTYSPDQKQCIATHYMYDNDIGMFERNLFLEVVGLEDTTTPLPWIKHTKNTVYPDVGFYLIKLRYIEGTTLLVFGISEGTVNTPGVGQRIHSAHTSHAVAGEVIVIDGNMRGRLRMFEAFVKVVTRNEKPPTGRVNGEEVRLLLNNKDDSYSRKIYEMARSFLRDGVVKSHLSITDQSSPIVSMPNEMAKDFFKNHKDACKQAYDRSPINADDTVTFQDVKDVLTQFTKSFPKQRPPSSNDIAYKKVLTRVELNVGIFIQQHVQAYYSSNEDTDSIGEEYLKLYRSFSLGEFVARSRYFRHQREDSRTSFEELEAEWKSNQPPTDPGESALNKNGPDLERPRTFTRSRLLVRNESTGTIERSEDIEDQPAGDGTIPSEEELKPCVCGIVHDYCHYEVNCDKCEETYEVDRDCVGYFDPNRLNEKSSWRCLHCISGTTAEGRKVTTPPVRKSSVSCGFVSYVFNSTSYIFLPHSMCPLSKKKRKGGADGVSSTKKSKKMKKSSPKPAIDSDNEPLPLKGGNSMSSRGRLRTPSRKARLLTENDLEDMYNDADFEDEYEESDLEAEEEEDDQVGANKKKRANSSPPNGNRKKNKRQYCQLTKAAKLESGLYKELSSGRLVKLCLEEGCTNVAVKEGVCIRHNRKKIKRQYCRLTKAAKLESGLYKESSSCRLVKLCLEEGCTNVARKEGVCIRHGSSWTKYTCKYEGCTNKVVQGGVCTRHGAVVKKTTCSFEGCDNKVQSRGLCTRHGGKNECSVELCTQNVFQFGKCWYHGPYGRGRNGM